jgi:hypothetical protein
MGWTQKKFETKLKRWHAVRTDDDRWSCYRAPVPEMEMNKPMLHSEITLLYT